MPNELNEIDLTPAITAGKPPLLRIDDTEPSPHWVRRHRGDLRALLDRHGVLMVRGLDLSSASAVAAVAQELTDTISAEVEGFADRDRLDAGVYSGAKWPADQPMCLHHELSYLRRVPRLLVFGCLRAPIRGGETVLADAHDVLRALPAELVRRFETNGWTLVRNYTGLVGVDWATAFGTTSPEQVRRYCAANDIELRWEDGGPLQTVQRRPAVIEHPVTGLPCWVNQIAFLNEWTMDLAIRDYLMSELGSEKALPFNTFCGDGTPLDEGTVELINNSYDANTLTEPWQDGDLMLVDNLRMAHGRRPYRGSREIAVVFGDPTPLTPIS